MTSVQRRHRDSLVNAAFDVLRDHFAERHQKAVEIRSDYEPGPRGPYTTYEDAYFASLDGAALHAAGELGITDPAKIRKIRKILEAATHSGHIITSARFRMDQRRWEQQLVRMIRAAAYTAALAIANGRWANNERRAHLRLVKKLRKVSR